MDVCMCIELQNKYCEGCRYDVYWYYILRDCLRFGTKTGKLENDDDDDGGGANKKVFPPGTLGHERRSG